MMRNRYVFFDGDFGQDIENVHYEPFHRGMEILNRKVKYKKKRNTVW